MKLNDEQIAARLADMEGWVRKDEKWMMKKYRFKAFLHGIEFVNEVAQISENRNHHPFISIDYKMVTLNLTTWKAGGLTELDFALAGEYDEAYTAIRAKHSDHESPSLPNLKAD